MIELINVSKYYPTEFGRHYVFRNVSLVLPPDKSVGIIGPNGAGKSTLLRLIGGADIPSEGRIIKTGRISPPMGLTPGLQSSLTGSENARFAGRIYGMRREEIADLIEYVRDVANIGKFFDMPVNTYSAGMRQRVGFAINMSMQFDYYLFDEISAGGDREFQKIAKAMVEERLATSRFLIASHRTDDLIDICTSGIVIQNGELTYYEDIHDALAAYGEDEVSEKRAAKKKERAARKAAGDGAAASAGNGAATGENGKARKRRRKTGKQTGGEALPLENAVAGAADAEADLPAVTGKPARSKRKVRSRRRTTPAAVSMPDTETQIPDPAPQGPPADLQDKATGESGNGTSAARAGVVSGAPAEAAARRRRRRLKKRQQASLPDEDTSQTDPDAVASIEPGSADESDSEGVDKREKRRLRRLQKRQGGGEPVSDELASDTQDNEDEQPAPPDTSGDRERRWG